MHVHARPLLLDETQRTRLLQTIARRRRSWITYSPHLDAIEAEIRQCSTAPCDRAGEPVATIGSRLWLARLPDDAPITRVLVEPELAAGDGTTGIDALSVLSPFGWALMGRRAGDLVGFPSGADRTRTYRVLRVLPPNPFLTAPKGDSDDPDASDHHPRHAHDPAAPADDGHPHRADHLEARGRHAHHPLGRADRSAGGLPLAPHPS